MTTQHEADAIGHTIAEISRESREAQIVEAFGRMNYKTWQKAMGFGFPPWDKLAAIERDAWIAGAAAVRKGTEDLVAEAVRLREKYQAMIDELDARQAEQKLVKGAKCESKA